MHIQINADYLYISCIEYA